MTDLVEKMIEAYFGGDDSDGMAFADDMQKALAVAKPEIEKPLRDEIERLRKALKLISLHAPCAHPDSQAGIMKADALKALGDTDKWVDPRPPLDRSIQRDTIMVKDTDK